MISFSRIETIKVDEKDLFESLKSYLFEEEIFDKNTDSYVDTVMELPESVQRLIFAKMGAMLINYSKSEDF